MSAEGLDAHDDLLRFVTCGSVDDGKSTLVGRMLYDAHLVPDDQLAALLRDSTRYHGSTTAEPIDFALLVDGLDAERERGITIDVAYRYFSTPKRKFIIADVPGHEQYTRNMATGASSSDLALVLVDARKGITEQTRRHTFIASLLGVRHIAVVVNKMDLVDYAEERFEAICVGFSSFAEKLDLPDIEYIPVCAIHGDNVVHRSRNMTWYEGRPLFDYLQNVHVGSDLNRIDFRFPVQLVLRHGDRRFLAGTIASGTIRRGESVVVLPSKQRARIEAITVAGEETEEAHVAMAVTIALDRHLDCGRGDMLTRPDNLPDVSRKFEAMVLWIGEQPLRPGHEYVMKHLTMTTTVIASTIRYRMDLNHLGRQDAAELETNDVGRVAFFAHRAPMFDPYDRNRATGAFVLIERSSNRTAGAGFMIRRAVLDERNTDALPALPSAIWIRGGDREQRSKLAQALHALLADRGVEVHVLGENELENGLNADLAGNQDDPEARRRLVELIRLMGKAGLRMIAAHVLEPPPTLEEADNFFEVVLPDGNPSAEAQASGRLRYVITSEQWDHEVVRILRAFTSWDGSDN